LGNVRLSYSDADGNGEVTGDIVVNNCSTLPDGSTACNNYIITGEAEGVTNYYPFGMMHNSESHNFENPYQYNYNGKELQEMGMYDYGARFYMPDVGRWGVVDPLAEASRRFTPYHYGNNNPVRFIDPDGRSVQTFTGSDAENAYWQFYRSGSVSSVTGGYVFDPFENGDFHMYSSNSDAGMMMTFALGINGQGGGSSTSSWINKNSGPGPTFDLLSLVLSLAGVDPNAPANMMSLGIISSLFAPKDAWIAVGNTDTMNEWSQGYIKFNTSSNGLFIDPADPNTYIKGITNPVTGKIILAPGLFDGKKTNYGLGDVVIHEVDHFNNWKNGKLQGNHPLIQDLNEVSAYKAASQWTGSMFGAQDYLKSINNYIFNLLHIITK
jgi:RHS repeat-associated protein